MVTTASVFGPSASSLTGAPSFGMSSFGTTTSESVQPVVQSSFGAFSQSALKPQFGFAVSTAAGFGFQPVQPLTQSQPTLQPAPFSFGAASSNPAVFGAQNPVPSTGPVFSLGKRANDDAGGDGNKRLAIGRC